MSFVKSEKVILNTDVLFTLSIDGKDLHVNTHGGLAVINFANEVEAKKIYEDLSTQLVALNKVSE